MKGLIIFLVAVVMGAVIVGCQVANRDNPVTLSYDNQQSGSPVLKVTQPQDESVVRSTPVAVSGTVNGAVQVTINGDPVDLTDNHFNTTVDLDPGPDSIDITARDAQGRETFRSISVVYVP